MDYIILIIIIIIGLLIGNELEKLKDRIYDIENRLDELESSDNDDFDDLLK
ncbi:MAG: hypothetical protein AAB411_00570 [Patescibacteria group bacterium]